MATALLEKQKVEQPENGVSGAAAAEAELVPFHWTVERFYRAADADVFDDPGRLELVQGRIMEKMPQDPIHRAMRVRLGRQFRAAFTSRLVVIEECPVRLADDTELIADVVAAYGEEAGFDVRHPVGEDVAVLVEVANTTTASDLGEKAMQYAQSVVSDYWVILLKENAVVVHRDPSQEGYKEVTRLTGEDTLSPLAMPDVVWTINGLFEQSMNY